MARSTPSRSALRTLRASGARVVADRSAFCISVSLRPGQWTKNLLVFAGLLFGNASGPVRSQRRSPRDRRRSLIFCALSGVVYLVNDIADRESDRQHPLKAQRPIASGALAGADRRWPRRLCIGGGALAASRWLSRPSAWWPLATSPLQAALLRRRSSTSSSSTC